VSVLGVVAVGVRAATAARRDSRVRARPAVPALLRRFGQASLSICGLGALTAAAWTVSLPLGLVSVGVSLFVVEWRVAE